MNLDFKILWFDDQSIDGHKRLIEDFLKNEYELKLIVSSKKGNEDISTLDIDSYDLILMDYGLIGDETGVRKYQEIRNRYSYVDVAFYSSKMQDCKKDLRALEQEGVDIEGVYYLEVNNDTLFEEKIQIIINKIVRRSESIGNLRGLILSETAKFDLKIHDLIVSLINKYHLHNIVDQYLNKKIHKDVCSSLASEEDKYKKHKCKIGFYFDERLNLPRLDSYKQVRVLNKILKTMKEKGVVIDPTFDYFSENYLKEIINFRNAFAHKIDKSGTIIINKEKIIVDDAFHKQMRSTLSHYNKLFETIENL